MDGLTHFHKHMICVTHTFIHVSFISKCNVNSMNMTMMKTMIGPMIWMNEAWSSTDQIV